jgi:hypothetical protein
MPKGGDRSGRATIGALLKGKWAPILKNPLEFISRLQIVDKKGHRVALIPNDEQMQIVEALEAPGDILVLKGRQIGSSTIICAWLFWKAYIAQEPLTLATMSHKAGSARHFLDIIRRMYVNLPSALQRPISIDNGGELRFGDSGAGIIAVSAEGKGGLRSFSCNALHISEFAFAEQPDELKATAIAALNGGKLIIESTANNWGDGLHREWMRVEKGEAEYNRLFFPWFAHKEYTSQVPLDDDGEPIPLSWRPDEEELKEEWELTDGQLLWRRQRIGKLGLEKFRREFPVSPEEAYTVAGSTYFKEEDWEAVEVLSIDNPNWTVLEEPQENDAYAIGVDVAAGVGRDYSVIFVMSKLTGSPAAIWRYNNVEPTALAEHIIDIASEYNDALVLVEANNFGGVVLNQLRHNGWGRLWKGPDGRDWVTSVKTKGHAFETMKANVIRGVVRHIDRITYDECRSITVNERGTIELLRPGGKNGNEGHSDSAMAFALASVCLDKVKLPEIQKLPEWIRQRRIDKIINNHGAACGPTRRYA